MGEQEHLQNYGKMKWYGYSSSSKPLLVAGNFGKVCDGPVVELSYPVPWLRVSLLGTTQAIKGLCTAQEQSAQPTLLAVHTKFTLAAVLTSCETGNLVKKAVGDDERMEIGDSSKILPEYT